MKEKDTAKALPKKWGYRQSFLVAGGLLIAGCVAGILTQGKSIPLLHWPYNIIAGIVLLNLLVILHLSAGKTRIIKWLSSVPAAIASLSLLTFLVLLLGFIPQNAPDASELIKYLGFSNITRSWVFALAQLFFLTTLGMVTLRRATPFNRKSIGFLLNHAGLWITVTAATLGAGDLKRLYMNLEEGADYTNVAFDQSGNAYQLKVALKLIDFQMETYPPKLVLFNPQTGNIQQGKGPSFVLTEEHTESHILGWQITVQEFLPDAFSKEDTMYYANESVGAAPAAYISITHKTDSSLHEGWVSSGSMMVPPAYIDISPQLSLAMLQPEAKKYSSEIEYITKELEQGQLQIEVNKPKTVNGWRIYQSGYDSAMGKWSRLSVVELVNDPWLPVVYTGIFMMLAGAIYLFWQQKTPTDPNEKKAEK